MKPHERLAVELVAQEEGRKIVAIVQTYCACGLNKNCLKCGGSGGFEYALAIVPNNPDEQFVCIQYLDGAVNVWSWPKHKYLYSVIPSGQRIYSGDRAVSGPFSELVEVK